MGGPRDPIYMYDLYTAMRYDNEQLSEPLPQWFMDTIGGTSTSFIRKM